LSLKVDESEISTNDDHSTEINKSNSVKDFEINNNLINDYDKNENFKKDNLERIMELKN